MRKLISIKDIAGKTVDPEMGGEHWSGEAVVHFSDGTSLLLWAASESCCGDEEARMEEIDVKGLESATDDELSTLYCYDVIDQAELDGERARRSKSKEAAQREAERAQYEKLKAKFEQGA